MDTSFPSPHTGWRRRRRGRVAPFCHDLKRCQVISKKKNAGVTKGNINEYRVNELKQYIKEGKHRYN